MTLATPVALATVYRTIGLVIMAIVFVAVAVYVLINVLSSGKPEVGSEIELAPNRKPYLSDEELEGKKLDKSLWWATGNALRHRHRAARVLGDGARPVSQRGRALQQQVRRRRAPSSSTRRPTAA